METSFLGKDGFIWWKGVVEDRKDPIFLGRLRVRIFGWHTDNKLELPTEDLPWSMPSLPLDNGRNPVGPKEGDWVWGFFLDGPEAQKPIVVGYIPGIDEQPANPEVGFFDPTPDEQLDCTIVPRPPEMCMSEEDAAQKDATEVKKGGKFRDPERLPGQNIAFGQLTKDYDSRKYKFDVNKDGKYDSEDADQITDLDKDGTPNNEEEFFSGVVAASGGVPISRYPLENRLMEPSTSRLSRNEKIEETIVALKKGELDSGEGGGYEGAAVGGDEAAQPLAFQEPETAYDAKYPYNHVYESESGHVIEVDDTPGAERMHWYHRSGTFKEIHPDGLEVNKIKKAQYNFIYEDYFNCTLGSMNLDAGDAYRLKAGSIINLNSGGDQNRQVGANLNALVSKSVNSRIKENTHTVIENESWTHVTNGTYLYVKEGVLHIKVEDEIVIESGKKIQMTAAEGIDLCSPIINLQGLGGAECVINLVSSIINSNFLMAHVAGIATPGLGEKPLPAVPSAPLKNEADNDDWYDEAPTDASLKYGFLLPYGSPGDVYKPISDSDKKLVTLSAAGDQHELREALPTGELEAVVIKYQHTDGSITEWEVVRPVHVPGDLIDSPVKVDMFEDGVRYLNRWSKPGKEYPKQMFWVVKGGPENLILDSGERHQCFPPAPFNDKISFDLQTTRPDDATGNVVDTNPTNDDNGL